MAKNMISKIIKLLQDAFKVVDENVQNNIVQGLSKNSRGETVLEIAPLYKETKMELTAHEILSNTLFMSYLNKRDTKLVKAILFSEGDILIKSKEFDNDNETILSLESLLTEEKWAITPTELLANNAIFSRINRKHLSAKLLPHYLGLTFPQY